MKKITTMIFISLLSWTTQSWGQQAVPEEAMRYMTRGQAAVETAKSVADYKKAVSEFERACELAPEWPDPYYNLGIVQEASGEYEAAAKSLQRYLELSPGAGDAAEVKKKIYKLEYLADRNNIDGVWKVDTGKYSIECDPKNCVLSYGQIVSPVSIIAAMQLEIKKGEKGTEARMLVRSGNLASKFPDGPFSSVEHERDSVKIYGAVLYACSSDVVPNSCPWEVKLILKQSSEDVMEGTIDAQGGVNTIPDYKTGKVQWVGFNGSGKIVFQRDK